MSPDFLEKLWAYLESEERISGKPTEWRVTLLPETDCNYLCELAAEIGFSVVEVAATPSPPVNAGHLRELAARLDSPDWETKAILRRRT